MNEHRKFVEQKRLERTRAAIEKNRMMAYVVDTAAEVAPLVKSLLREGDSVSNGGTMTLGECGLYDLLRGGDYDYIDRDAATTPEGKLDCSRRALSSDWYIASANAIAETGEIVEMDGTGNRVAALCFGPKNVLLIAGRNKIAPTLEDARARVRQTASPANTHRFSAATPCATTGQCVDCSSPGRICSMELILHQQMIENRIRVILVNEDLGF